MGFYRAFGIGATLARLTITDAVVLAQGKTNGPI
jgi:hypothetical protein